LTLQTVQQPMSGHLFLHGQGHLRLLQRARGSVVREIRCLRAIAALSGCARYGAEYSRGLDTEGAKKLHVCGELGWPRGGVRPTLENCEVRGPGGLPLRWNGRGNRAMRNWCGFACGERTTAAGGPAAAYFQGRDVLKLDCRMAARLREQRPKILSRWSWPG
jgi:hypothetical protein